MLKGLATWFLNNYLGKYLEDLNTDQLRIALSQGEVELENAPFRKEAFKFLDPALDVKAGFVGHIKLKVPVSKLRTEPWTLLLEKVYILFGPQKFTDFDEDLEEQVLLGKKLLSLDGIEAEWRALEEASGSYDQWKSQGSSFISSILENLQVHIQDVHIRYEDDFTSPIPFSYGIVLDSLSAETCDENWLPKFVARNANSQTHIFKTLDLRYLGLYLNVGPDLEIFGACDIHTLSEKMSSRKSIKYLLKPVSLNATLKKNCQFRALKSKKIPRFVIDVKVNSIPLEISSSQYSCALHGLRAFHQLRKNRRVWRWRPKESVKKCPRAWWHYAITSHMERIHKRNAQYSWSNVLSMAQENVKYVDAFREYLLNPVGISQDIKMFKDSTDASRTYEELKILRNLVVFQLKNELPSKLSNQNKKALTWYEWWYGIEIPISEECTSENEADEEQGIDQDFYRHKDAVMARIHFSLESGSLKLFSMKDIGQKREIFEFEFEKMKTNFESRPRSKSYKFELSLGAMYLRDRISTEASMFPILISPANVAGAPLCPIKSRNIFTGFAKSTLQSILGSTTKTEESFLFYLLFETNPSSNLDVKFHCRSESLNIVYNPIIVHYVSDFLRIPSDLNKSSNLSEKIKSAALNRIEEAKKRTKKELKKNLHQIFDTEGSEAEEGFLSGKKKLDISFELSAPQILIPESFVDKNALIFVVDFGKLHLSNGYHDSSAPKPIPQEINQSNYWDDEDDEDEEFCTPISTPEELEVQEEEDLRKSSVPKIAELDSSRLYTSFSLTLSDMQVLISKIKDNWKYAHLKGTSSLHILDKFSIKLQLEKRIASLSDSEFPNIVIAGSLPRIVVHFNEEKIFALKRMNNLLRGNDFESSSAKIRKNCVSVSTQTLLPSHEEFSEELTKSESDVIFSSWGSSNPINQYSRLFLIYFCIDDLAIELQSQDKSIAEIQVTGVKASLTRRPFDTNISLSVHSLLVVDAIQTFGPNFELLVASHRNVCVDSISGSLRGSEPASPLSPFSPSFASKSAYQRDAPPLNIHKALSSLQKGSLNNSRVSMSSSIGNNVGFNLPEMIDPDALIVIDVVIISPHCPGEDDSNEQHKIISVQFNSLDIIANQETIIELIGFMKRISPEMQSWKSRHLPLKDSGTQTTECEIEPFSDLESSISKPHTKSQYDRISTKTELTAEFQRLNVLLLRANTGKMIGTALLTEVKILSSFGRLVEVSGSLGGLHVINLLSGSSLHQKIISIGKDPFIEGESCFFNKSIHDDLYNSSSQIQDDIQAFTFNFAKKAPIELLQDVDIMDQEIIDINVRIASVCYIHSFAFLEELNSCASDFKTYMSNLASSIRNAATEMALGIVHRRTESMAMHETILPTSKFNKLCKSSSYSENNGFFAPAPTPKLPQSFTKLPAYKLSLDVLIETPVIVIPSHERSFEILVAHLGEIIIRNEEVESDLSMERYIIKIKDMNIHSMDLRKKYKESDLLDLLAHFKVMTSKELYSCHVDHSIPILHDTEVDLIICKGAVSYGSMVNESKSFQSFLSLGEEQDLLLSRELYNISCAVSDTLKITINRSQYEQILMSLKSSPKDDEVQHTSRTTRKESNSELISPVSTVLIESDFKIPNLIVKLRDSKDSDLVNVNFQEFAVYYKKYDAFKYNLDIILKSLFMEDLLLPNGAKHRQLMTSIGEQFYGSLTKSFKNGLSKSCPNLRRFAQNKHLGASLPSLLNVETIFGIPINEMSMEREKKKQHKEFKSTSSFSGSTITNISKCSKNDLCDVKNLVHIKIEEYDINSQELNEQELSTKRLVDVDFNNLDIVINIKTWVIILDFFSMSKRQDEPDVSSSSTFRSSPTPPASTSSWGSRSRFEPELNKKPLGNTKIDLRVKSLSVLLNKPEYELSKISVNNFAANMISSEKDFTIKGHLGNFSLKDLTPTGRLYSDRFISRKGSNRVLSFNFFKYSALDEKLGRDFDSSLSLHMDQVIYVHTQRFYTELLAFFAHFSHLQKLMDQSIDPQNESSFPRTVSREIRLKLEIDAESTIIFLPMSSFSTRILTVDLGQLSVRNKFAFSGDPSTISPETLSTTLVGQRSRAQSCESLSSRRSRSRMSSRRRAYNSGDDDDLNDSNDNSSILVNELHNCLIDVLNINLKSMDLKMGDRISGFTDEKLLTPQDISVHGFIVRLSSKQLLKEKCELQLQIERNLDKAFSHRVPDLSLKGILSTVHAVVNPEQYQTIRGLLSYNIGEAIEEFNLHYVEDNYNQTEAQMIYGDKIWKRLFMNIELQDVILDLQQEDEIILARINFYKSKLIYESWSDSSRDVDLVSQEICLSDFRYIDCPPEDQPNVFTKILYPMKNISYFGNLQAEVHYRSTLDMNRLTILLNNMRLMSLFDWWFKVLEFISKCPTSPPEFNKEKNNEPVTRFVYLDEEPIYPSVGIISKRTPMIETSGPVFELKINITESEIVILAEPFNKNSQAIILHSTTVIAYRPDMSEKPFSCNLNNAEVFSCVLGHDESTLSIIDPVTINLEIGQPSNSLSNSSNKGLNNFSDKNLERCLEIHLQQLNVRLSYHDWIIIQFILKLFPEQAKAAFENEGNDECIEDIKSNKSVASDLDCIEALDYTTINNNLSQVLSSPSLEDSNSDDDDDMLNRKTYFSGSKVNFSHIELKTNTFNICIIDDCLDADVPLLELSLGRVHLKHDISSIGSVSCDVQASYHNRSLGSWEPLIEPLHSEIEWNLRNRVIVNVSSEDILNLNITSSLIKLYRTVRNNWTQDYYSQSDAMKPRIPFVPFALKNETGCDLIFCTYVSQSSVGLKKKTLSKIRITDCEHDYRAWISVKDGATIPFTFEERGKFRQINSRENKVHQIVVKVEGWVDLCPVSVDKVGTYFRNVKASPLFAHKVPPARIVVDISLEGSARKLVKIRSALLVSNKLPYSIKLILDKVRSNKCLNMEVPSKEIKSIPLSYVWATIHGKPGIGDWDFCDNVIEYSQVKSSDSAKMTLYQCKHAWNKLQEPERFCITVERLQFPCDEKIQSNWMQPAHLISFASPITIISLLPYQLSYSLRNTMIQGSLDPGNEACLSVELSEQNIIHISVDQFPIGSDIVLPQNVSTTYEVRVRLGDSNNRPLYLTAQIICKFGGIVRISVFASYWLVNKTGLPLIFREEKGFASPHLTEESSESEKDCIVAGQEKEHEIARMAEPLTFSFSEENKETLSMRIGNGLHTHGKSQWCKAFYIQQKGSFVRRLRVLSQDKNTKKEIVYNIGVDIVSGKEKFDKTLIVTLTPRLQLHNRSKFMILMAQKCQIMNNEGSTESFLESPPGSSVSFHWPHLNQEHLLCVKLPKLYNCSWSGGFVLENTDSFQFNVRDGFGKSVLLRVEIGLVGATYSVIFVDADSFPPPFRIDNFSHVPIAYYQNGTESRSIVKPKQINPYALDEPTLKPILTCLAPGCSMGVYDLNRIGEGDQLTYENFIYITLLNTFSDDLSSPGLVLDVESRSNRVILAPKLTGKRSQLWRMTASGLLQHEGSSPPRDPNHPTPSTEPIVLDIAGPAVQPHAYIPLVLRKADDRRRLTQRWKFTNNGRLMCEHKGLYVQAKSDLKETSIVLGPNEFKDTNPVELGFTRQRMRPGSGVLSVFVHTDGPTRVLLITDTFQQSDRFIQEKSRPTYQDYTVTLNFKQGIGLSLISSDPSEELVYGLLSNVQVEYTTRNDLHILDIGVQNIQIDNQIFNSQYPSILYSCKSTKKDEYRHMPAIHFTAAKQRQSLSIHNAEIYDNMILTIKGITLNLEEELICKIVRWAGILDLSDFQNKNTKCNFSNTFEKNQESMISNTICATRYYFGTLKIALNNVKLSVLKSNRLKGDVKLIQRKLNLFLITFESANIKLEPYLKSHPFETASFLFNSILKHYQHEMIRKTLLILGSTDFLGNPAGLANDWMEGFRDLLDGNMVNSIINVTHGAANTAAKFSGSLSYGMSKISLQEKYDEKRLMLRGKHGETSMRHLMAAIKGLGFGALGGVTSIYDEVKGGVKDEGPSGIINGILWGLAGVVMKPAIGVLDFATEAATALKESSKTVTNVRPPKIRAARPIYSPAGAFPIYNKRAALGQERLSKINDHNNEIYVTDETLVYGHIESDVIVSFERILVYQKYHSASNRGNPISTTKPEVDLNYSQVEWVKVVPDGNLCNLEIYTVNKEVLKVMGDSEKKVYDLSQKINYAMTIFQELQFALPTKESDMDNEL
ncbi:intermembrane lipid transfer protein VPS13D [Lepeophtheirus salmonis]|uniref:intermembrane lipid transfer protein VPS13D n=1 Tax=Lepeophtheirus salmonis TaxID=72036 RepID=UPI001AE2C0CB|nr:vacuolar protein sorting-associated protein 13D-like [Lepeophtheirus salmonis]